jgi:hypothetical protein
VEAGFLFRRSKALTVKTDLVLDGEECLEEEPGRDFSDLLKAKEQKKESALFQLYIKCRPRC